MSTSAPRISIVDTYYNKFQTYLTYPGGTYADELAWLLNHCFGTYDCYSRGLATLRWDAQDIIGNNRRLQVKWVHERDLMDSGFYLEPITRTQLKHFDPDVLFMQDLNYFEWDGPANHKEIREYVLAGQCSCAWPGDDTVKWFDIIFTSFPHYIPRIEALGVKAVYLPLAFDPIVYERMPEGKYERNIPWSFVGGLESQFGSRVNTVFRIHAEIPGLIYGYGGKGSYSYSQPLWGLDMYKQYARSKIVLNTHHPAAEGYSNNLRMYEATGMGALLLTEASPNIGNFFIPGVECITYSNVDDAIDQIQYYLDPRNEPARLKIAAAGHLRTLRDHTYTQRMPIVDRELRALLESKKQKAG